MCHNDIMRTTVNIPDHLLIEAKKLAATRRSSLASVIADSLRKYLSEYRGEPVGRAEFKLPVVHAGSPIEGVDLDDTSMLVEL